MKHIYEREESQRIDKFLTSLHSAELYSRSFIDKLITKGLITVNNKIVKKSHLLSKGDVIEVVVPEPEEKVLKGENISLNVTYEDQYLAVINKPAGISVHPSPGKHSGTIANAILNRFGNSMPFLDTPCRPGIVHRLDKQTSGLMIIAKDDRTLSLLSRAFSGRKIKKYYRAILLGIPDNLEGTIRTFISRDRKDRLKMTVSAQGRESITRYRIIRTYSFFSLVDVIPVTGRTHQIRVHFKHLNYPIAGDDIYGQKGNLLHIPYHYQKKVSVFLENNLNRQALHAYRLQFLHPITGKEMDISIDLPKDMITVLGWLEKQFGFSELVWDSSFE